MAWNFAPAADLSPRRVVLTVRKAEDAAWGPRLASPRRTQVVAAWTLPSPRVVQRQAPRLQLSPGPAQARPVAAAQLSPRGGHRPVLEARPLAVAQLSPRGGHRPVLEARAVAAAQLSPRGVRGPVLEAASGAPAALVVATSPRPVPQGHAAVAIEPRDPFKTAIVPERLASVQTLTDGLCSAGGCRSDGADMDAAATASTAAGSEGAGPSDGDASERRLSGEIQYGQMAVDDWDISPSSLDEAEMRRRLAALRAAQASRLRRVVHQRLQDAPEGAGEAAQVLRHYERMASALDAEAKELDASGVEEDEDVFSI